MNYLDDHTKAAIGYWRYTGRFETLSPPTSASGRADSRGNDGLYAFVERRLTREGTDDEQGLAGWSRWGLADARLKPIAKYVGGGLAYTGPFKHRDEDEVGVAIGVAEFGGPFRRGSALAGNPLDAREVIIEATYRAPVTSWLTLQPDLRYIISPSGRLTAQNGLVVGLRAELGF